MSQQPSSKKGKQPPIPVPRPLNQAASHGGAGEGYGEGMPGNPTGSPSSNYNAPPSDRSGVDSPAHPEQMYADYIPGTAPPSKGHVSYSSAIQGNHPQQQQQQQQQQFPQSASYNAVQKTFFPNSGASYDEKAPLQMNSYADFTTSQAGAGKANVLTGATARERRALSPFRDTTPYGIARFKLIESYSEFQRLLDRSIPHVGPRWVSFAFLFIVFWWRIFALQGFYVVAYAVSIYQLNLFLLFLTPKFLEDLPQDPFDPDGEDDTVGLGSSSRNTPLPLKSDDEFRPFIRRLPEFKFWWLITKGLLYSVAATLFPVFDIPVFWPILVVYFVALFGFTMRRQIEHMIAHRYIPFDFGKKRFAGLR